MRNRIDQSLLYYDPHGAEVATKTIDGALWKEEAELMRVELARPELWSPSSPNLYRCEVALEPTEDLTANRTASAHRFGVRSARFEEHGPFFLNGGRLQIRGTQRREDHAGYAAAMPDALIREEMRLMKEMGANFIRLAHYQQSRLVLELADELGRMVWGEIPWCRSGVVSDLFRQQGRDKLTAMIDQHRNHPSVVIWGLSNEDDWPTEAGATDNEAIRKYMSELQALAHTLAAFSKMLTGVILPLIHEGSGANGNWELSMMDVMTGIAVLFDGRPLLRHAEAMWRERVPAYFYNAELDGAHSKPMLRKREKERW